MAESVQAVANRHVRFKRNSWQAPCSMREAHSRVVRLKWNSAMQNYVRGGFYFFLEAIPVFISKWATLPSLMSNSFCLSNKQSRPSVCAETVFTVFSLFCFRAGIESVFKMEYGRLCFRCLWKDTRIYDEEGALLETTGLAAVGMLFKNQPTRSCFLKRLAHSETKFHFVPTAIEWCLTNRKVHSIFQLSVAAIFDPNCNGIYYENNVKKLF